MNFTCLRCVCILNLTMFYPLTSILKYASISVSPKGAFLEDDLAVFVPVSNYYLFLRSKRGGEETRQEPLRSREFLMYQVLMDK